MNTRAPLLRSVSLDNLVPSVYHTMVNGLSLKVAKKVLYYLVEPIV